MKISQSLSFSKLSSVKNSSIGKLFGIGGKKNAVPAKQSIRGDVISSPILNKKPSEVTLDKKGYKKTFGF